jgi:hypothetical protein
MNEAEETTQTAGPAPEPHAMALLGAHRDEEDIPSDVKARLWQRLDAAPATAAAHIPARRRRAVWIGLALAAGVALLIIAPRLADQTNQRDDSSAAYQGSRLPPVGEAKQSAVVRDDADGGEPAEVEDSGAATATAADEVGEADDAGETPDADHGAVKKRPGSKPHSTKAPAPENLGDSLAEETALLGQAQAALSGGKPKQALVPLREHKRKFPSGMLAEERRALMVVALCDSGELSRGRKQAKRFLSQHPGSGLRDRVAAACPKDGE